MGLDMYLDMKVSHYPKKGETTIDLANLNGSWDTLELNEFGASNRVDISLGVGYWRKANHIHNWFVKNIQDKNDNCGEYYVIVEEFEKLYDICMGILKKLDGWTFTIKDDCREEYENRIKKDGCELENIVTFDINKLKYFYSADLYMHIRNLDGDDEEIGKLIDYCNDNLPHRNGCFFGEQDFNWWYFHDIIKTVLIIDKVMELKKQYEEKNILVDFTYRSSW